MKYSRTGYWGLPAAGVTIAILGALTVSYAMPHGHSWPKALVLSIIVIASFAMGLTSWRHADEVLLQMHKTAWFWGSQIAVALLTPAIIAMAWGLVPIPFFDSLPQSTSTGLVAGFGFTLLAQLTGYGLVCYYKRLVPHV